MIDKWILWHLEHFRMSWLLIMHPVDCSVSINNFYIDSCSLKLIVLYHVSTFNHSRIVLLCFATKAAVVQPPTLPSCLCFLDTLPLFVNGGNHSGKRLHEDIRSQLYNMRFKYVWTESIPTAIYCIYIYIASWPLYLDPIPLSCYIKYDLTIPKKH